MRALLLPIKDLNNAKKRLMGVLTPEERFGLAEAMLKDTIRAVQGVRLAKKIFVITNYQPAMSMAEENGWEILREERQISESDFVDAAGVVPVAFRHGEFCETRWRSGTHWCARDLPQERAAGDGCG